MADPNLLFSGPMVQGLRQDRKTQTRRTAKPRWQVGDLVWVRETWKPHSLYAGMKPSMMPHAKVFYRADDTYAPSNTPWVPSIHMPRWASRLTLLITEVRSERLLDISRADAIAEGVEMETADPPFYYVPYVWPHTLTAVGVEDGVDHAQRSYFKLWDHINGRGASTANPMVFATTFKVFKDNIDVVKKTAGQP